MARITHLRGVLARRVTEQDMRELAEAFPGMLVERSDAHLQRTAAWASYLPDMDAGRGNGILLWCEQTRVIDVEHEMRHRQQDLRDGLAGDRTARELEVTEWLLDELAGDLDEALRSELLREREFYREQTEEV